MVAECTKGHRMHYIIYVVHILVHTLVYTLVDGLKFFRCGSLSKV